MPAMANLICVLVSVIQNGEKTRLVRVLTHRCQGATPTVKSVSLEK